MIIYADYIVKKVSDKVFRVPLIDVVELTCNDKKMVLDTTESRWNEKKDKDGNTRVLLTADCNLCENDHQYEPVENEQKYLNFLSECQISNVEWNYSSEEKHDYELENQNLKVELDYSSESTDISFDKIYKIGSTQNQA